MGSTGWTGSGSCVVARVLALLVLLTPAAAARADFFEGIERFNGTTRDTLAWEEYNNASGGTLTQNDKITIQQNANNQFVDYTTRSVAVPVGGRVRAQATQNILGGYAQLFLTINSAGRSAPTPFDSYWIELQLLTTTGTTASSAVFAGGDQSGSHKGSAGAFAGDGLGDPFVLELARPSSTTVRATLFDGNGNPLLPGGLLAVVNDHPDPLYISLSSHLVTQTDWDNVEVVPEPTVSMPLVVAATYLALRRRHRGGRRGA
jgi:hypothetical protein